MDKLDHPSQGIQNPMLLVEDNGGGMEPAVIRHCMSFGFSRKKGALNASTSLRLMSFLVSGLEFEFGSGSYNKSAL